QIENINKIGQFYGRIEKDQGLVKINLDNYRVVKGLAIGLTTSYIFMEDDLHRNNLSKDGKRFDFDMSLWPLLYNFKQASFLEIPLVFYRGPNEASFKVTTEDVINFPC